MWLILAGGVVALLAHAGGFYGLTAFGFVPPAALVVNCVAASLISVALEYRWPRGQRALGEAFFVGLICPAALLNHHFAKTTPPSNWRTDPFIFATFALFLCVFYIAAMAFRAPWYWTLGWGFGTFVVQLALGASRPRGQNRKHA